MANSHLRTLRRIGRFVLALLTFGLAACAGPGKAGYEPAPGSYFLAPVGAGDTVGTVAKRYSVGEDDVAALNRVPNRDTPLTLKSVRVPAYGRLHDPNELARVPRLRSSPVESRPLQPTKRASTDKPLKAGTSTVVSRNEADSSAEIATTRRLNMQSARRIDPSSSKPAVTVVALRPASGPSGPASLSQPRPVEQANLPVGLHKFLWPVKGRLLSSFGTGADGERNDGINIAANLGAPIRAADAGEVTYVGNDLKGYGNLVLIRHDDGFVTAYAHAEKVLVARKERVSRGEIIAYAGATGDVTQPQLHFELRRNTKPVDPQLYLAVASN